MVRNLPDHRRALCFLVGLLTLSVISVPASGNRVAILGQTGMVIVGTEKGELQLWEKGQSRPQWTLRTQGIGSGTQSPISLLREFGVGRILLVERLGRVMLIDASDPKKQTSKLPIMAWIKLGVDRGDVDWQHWDTQLEAIDRVAAAAADQRGRLLFSSIREPVVFRIELTPFFEQPDDAVTVADLRRFFFKDENFGVNVKGEHVPFAEMLLLPTYERERQSALAICGAKTIVGTDGGTVYFVPTEGDWHTDGRMRRLRSDGEPEWGSGVLDAGCLGSGLAYTITSPGSFGQVQLWDLETGALIDKVDTDEDGFPLFTFQAVASTDGKRLLGLGDTHLHVWSVENRHLVVLGRQLTGPLGNHRAAAALPDGDFLLFDGERLWTLTADGKSKTLFAGEQEPPK